jgi:ankyrin repeat protein
MADLSPLGRAIDRLDADEVSRLLAQGADVNDVDSDDGWSSLHLAIDAEVDEATQAETPLTDTITRMLLAAGADRTLRTAEGETPLDMARRRGHRLAESLLLPQPE